MKVICGITDVITSFLRFVGLGCKHKNISWPRYDLRRGSRGVYVTCFDCSREITYVNKELIPTSGGSK